MFNGKTSAFYTLGCKLNFSETSTISRQLKEIGFVKNKFNEGADLFVINTCSVTENADKEAVENMVVGRGLDKAGVTEEQSQRFRRHAASGNGALPIVGDPDQVVSMMKRLYGYGISALAMGFANYIDHLPYFKNEVLPRLVSEGLRVD